MNCVINAEMPTILIFEESYPFSSLTIWNVKITANNHFKMIPDKIMGVTPTSSPVIPDHW